MVAARLRSTRQTQACCGCSSGAHIDRAGHSASVECRAEIAKLPRMWRIGLGERYTARSDMPERVCKFYDFAMVNISRQGVNT